MIDRSIGGRSPPAPSYVEVKCFFIPLPKEEKGGCQGKLGGRQSPRVASYGSVLGVCFLFFGVLNFESA